MNMPILKLHPLEHIIVPKSLQEHAYPPNILFLKMIECYCNDFIAICQAKSVTGV